MLTVYSLADINNSTGLIRRRIPKGSPTDSDFSLKKHDCSNTTDYSREKTNIVDSTRNVDLDQPKHAAKAIPADTDRLLWIFCLTNNYSIPLSP